MLVLFVCVCVSYVVYLTVVGFVQSSVWKDASAQSGGLCKVSVRQLHLCPEHLSSVCTESVFMSLAVWSGACCLPVEQDMFVMCVLIT